MRPLSRYSSSRTPGRVSRFERSDWCRRVAPNLCSRSACAPRSTAPSPRRPFDALLTHLCPRPATLSLSFSFSRLSFFALANARIRSFARFLRRSRYRSLIFSPSLISFSLFLEIEIRIEIEKKKSRIFIDVEDRDRAIRGERKREL